MSQIKAVIFDRDGVLADFNWKKAKTFYSRYLPSLSIEELSEIWQKWGEENGFPATLAEEDKLLGAFWQYIGREFLLPRKSVDALVASKYTDYLLLFPEVAAILEGLKSQNIKVGVLSNFELASIEGSLEALDILQYVDVACSATTIGISKPAPRAYEIVMERLDVPPQNTLYFDDWPGHVAGACDAGIENAYLVDRKPGVRFDLGSKVVANLSDVKLIMKSLNG